MPTASIEYRSKTITVYGDTSNNIFAKRTVDTAGDDKVLLHIDGNITTFKGVNMAKDVQDVISVLKKALNVSPKP